MASLNFLHSTPTGGRVSVIMPFLNAAPFLGEAIESVLAQTYSSWELLLIDDGSEDGSTAIAQGYAQRHREKIRYLQHEARQSRGASASRNLGLAQARGEYIAILDSDDIAERRRLEKQVVYLDAHPEVALLGTWYTVINSAGRRIRSVHGQLPAEHLDIRWALLFYCPFLHSSVMFRKAPVLEQVGGYDEALVTSEDFELWTRIAPFLSMANLRECLVRYRVHESSLTSTRGGQAQVGHRMRVDTVSRLLGWGEDGFDLQERRLEAMSRLLVGPPGECTAEALDGAVDDIFSLHAAFCREAGLTATEASLHRTQLRSLVSENLVVLATSCGLRHHNAARKLLRRAYQLHRPVFFRGRTLARLCNQIVHNLTGRQKTLTVS